MICEKNVIEMLSICLGFDYVSKYELGRDTAYKQ